MALRGRQRELPRQVGQRLERCPSLLINLGTGLGGQTRALLDRRQGGVGLELTRAQQICRVLQASSQLDEGFGHLRKTIEPPQIGPRVTVGVPAPLETWARLGASARRPAQR
jgi:hypothetical protein